MEAARGRPETRLRKIHAEPAIEGQRRRRVPAHEIDLRKSGTRRHGFLRSQVGARAEQSPISVQRLPLVAFRLDDGFDQVHASDHAAQVAQFGGSGRPQPGRRMTRRSERSEPD